MTVEEMWSAYLHSIGSSLGRSTLTFRTRRFSDRDDEADELAALVIEGRKRATAPCVWQFVEEPLPTPGDLYVVTDGSGEARCVVRTTRVRIVPYSDVPADFIRMEGEGDGSVDYWRRAHWAYYTRVLATLGKVPDESMPIVCQEFEVVYAGEEPDSHIE